MGLSGADSEQIAIAMSRVLGTRLHSSWVQASKQPAAGAWKIRIATENVWDRLYPFEDSPEWASIREPALKGYGLDARPYRLRFDQHSLSVGKTRSGKSSDFNGELAYVTRCGDAVAWVGGVHKLYDSLAGWIEPYAGTDEPLPIDWIAHGQCDVLEMLAAAMRIGRWRQSVPMARRGGWPTLLVYVDEASYPFQNEKAKIAFDGQMLSASQLAAMIVKGVGSAGVVLKGANQRGTPADWGPAGNDLMANSGYRTVFRTCDEAEVGRALGWTNYKVEQPTYQGQFWLRHDEGQPVMLKAPYLQEIDPTKPKLHGGLTVSDVAWARRNFHVVLDPGSTQAAGEAYARRHVRMDDALLRYLTGAVAPPSETELRGSGASSADPAQAGYEAAVAEIRAIESVAGQNAVTPLVGRVPRAQRIVQIVRAASGSMTFRSIVDALHAGGDEAADQVVTNALTKLVSDGALVRPELNQYDIPGRAPGTATAEVQ